MQESTIEHKKRLSRKMVILTSSQTFKTLEKTSLSDILEEQPDQKYFLSPRIAKRILSYLPSRQDIGGGQANGGYIGNKPKQIIGGSQGNRVYGTDGVSTTLASQAAGLGAKTGLYMVDDPSRKKGLVDKNLNPTLRKETHGNLPVVAIPVLTPDRIVKRQNGRRFKTDGEPSFTLNTQDKHGIYDGLKIRRLTPVECCRLQGFPDNWCDGISDSQKYKCLGNAVTVNVIKAIMERIYEKT